MTFPNTYGTSGFIAQDQKAEFLNPDQSSMMKYTAITDSPFGALPTTSSVFTQPGTVYTSDLEEPLMMSMNGLKNAHDGNHTKKGKSSKLRAPLEGYVTVSESGFHTHAGSFLQSSSNTRRLALSHQNC